MVSIRISSKISIVVLVAALSPLKSTAQDFIYINENNKIQTGTPTRSFQYVKEVILKPGFSVSSANGEWYARPYDVVNAPPSMDQSFVRTEKALVQIGSEAAMSELSSSQKITSYEYVDGLGRKSQSIQVKASPAQKDLIVPFEYDAYGRMAKEYLPFTSNQQNGTFQTSGASKALSFYNSPPTGIPSDSRPFSEKVFELSPLDRVTDVYGPGVDWKNGTIDKPVTSVTKLNLASENIMRWRYYTSGFPSRNGNYPANRLSVTEVKDEDGQITREYKNVQGQIVLSRVGSASNWFDTYYIYSPTGNLMFVIQPEGVARLASEYEASGADKQSFLDRWAFQYQYDDERRMIAKRAPGAVPGSGGWTYIVYDRWGRVRLTQTPEQRITNQYSFTKYDQFNRVVLTGLTTISGTIATVRNNVVNSTARFESPTTGSVGYTSDTYPSHIANHLTSITYYDNYNLINNTGWDAEGNNFNFSPPSGYPNSSERLTSVKGHVTGSKVRILPNGKWLNSVTYYDYYYRPIQVIEENYTSGIQRTTMKYDFVGKVLKEHLYNSLSGDVIEKEYGYDNAERLSTIHHKINSQPKILMASNKYNEVGQLIEKNVHSTNNGSTFLQSVDYRYNIRGWLKSINNSGLNVSANNDDTDDLFGMELIYNTPNPAGINGFTQKNFYSGNISAIKWKTDTKQETPVEQIYAYDYDIHYRLKEANYARNTGTSLSPSWNGEGGMYDEKIPEYDKNGNIKRLTRYNKVQGSKALIDDLTYSYLLSGKESNRLVAMEDGTGSVLGFKPAPASVTEEYSYDRNGNLTFDHNKGISQIAYNHLNLPTLVQFTRPGGAVDEIQYVYDATGIKRSKIVRINGVQVWKTDYLGSFQYDNDALTFASTPEGRAVKNGGGFDYEYFHKDHLGNIRLGYGALKETVSYRATMEQPLAGQEESDFHNIATTRHQNSTFNYTKSSTEVVNPDKSARTNGHSSVGKPVGPAKSLRVLTGDAVYMEVYARYNQVSGSSAAITAAVLGAAVTGAFGIVNGGETATLWQGMNTNAAVASSGIPPSTTVPKAYLVYLFFDDNHIFQRSAAKSISNSAYNNFEKLDRSFTADKNGHLYIYVANESNVSSAINVYFDEMSIVHQKNNSGLQVTQAADYYPFGLTFNEYNADRIKADASEPLIHNRHLYQGQELQKDLDLGWYHYKWRMHDPAIGRFGAVDPLASEAPNWTPFSAMWNNPILNIDPDGRWPGEFEVRYDNEGNSVRTKVSPLGDDVGIDFNHYLNGEFAGQTEIVNTSNGITNWISDSRYIRGYSHRGPEVNWNTIFSEWLNGTGPENSLIFGRDHQMISDIIKSNLYHGARNEYLEAKAWDFDNEISKKYIPLEFGLMGLVLSGKNMTMQMIGASGVSFYDIGDNQRLVILTDSKTRTSFYYHLPWIENKQRNTVARERSAGSNDWYYDNRKTTTNQTYIWVDNNIE